MRVLRIKARNFRNYAALEIVPAPGVNVIRGKNAQGKTNLIEGLYLALRGFSFRTARINEVLRWGQEQGFVEVQVERRDGRAVSIRVDLRCSEKTILLAGKPVAQTELGRQFGVVLFTPDDLQLVKGAPSARRRFLDLELGCFVPGYVEALKRYRQALHQRNHLLRRGGRAVRETLDQWTEQLCRYGAGVILGRLTVLREFVPLACRLFSAWAGEDLAVRYRSSVNLNNDDRRAPVEENLRRAFAAVHQDELRLGRTQVGPHLDDLAFIINGRDARSFASQGQQRSVVLALKLAQITLWERYTGETPVALLDDVLFEFDRERRVRVLETVRTHAQVFLTAGERVFPGDSVFRVESGVIRKERE